MDFLPWGAGCSSGLLPGLQPARGHRYKPWQTRIKRLVFSTGQTTDTSELALGKGRPEEGSGGSWCARSTPSCSGRGGDGSPTRLMRDRGTHHPRGHSWASPRSCWCCAEQLGCKTSQESSCGRGSAHQPLLQPGVLEFTVWVSPRAAGLRGASKGRGRAVLQAALGWEGGCGVVPSGPEGSPIPGHSSVAPEGAGSGRVLAARAKLRTAKAFLSGGRLKLKPASFSLPKHLLSCALPSPLPCSISGHGNV